MDVTSLKYESNTYDFVVDKSTIDALLCGDYAYSNVAKMMKEVQRVLKVGGLYIAISYGFPENRSMHFEREFLKFDLKTIELKPQDNKGSSHYLYICQKLEGADELSETTYPKIIKQIEREENDEDLFDSDDDEPDVPGGYLVKPGEI